MRKTQNRIGEETENDEDYYEEYDEENPDHNYGEEVNSQGTEDSYMLIIN